MNKTILLLWALFINVLACEYATASGKPEIFAQMGHSGPINSISFSPDGRYVVSAASEGSSILLASNVTVKLWDAASGREIRTLGTLEKPLLQPVSSGFSPDGRYIFSSGREEVKIWDVADGKELRRLSVPDTRDVISAAISRDGKTISILQERRLGIWDISSGKEIKTLQTFVPFMRALTPGSKYFYTPLLYPEDSYSDVLVDIETGERVNGAKSIRNNPARYAAFARSGKISVLASIGDGKQIELWDVLNGNKTISLTPAGSVDGVAISPDGKYFLALLEQNKKRSVKVWDGLSGVEIRTLAGRELIAAAFSPEGNVLVGDSNGNLRLISVKTGQEMIAYGAHKPVLCHEGVVAISADKKYLITIVGDCADAVVWNIKNGKLVKVFKEGENIDEYIKPLSFTYNKDDKLPMHLYMSTTRDYTVDGVHLSFSPLKLYDSVSGKEVAQFIRFLDGEWVVITAEGYYNSSANGDKHLNVRIGNNVYGVDQYREKFYRPEVVAAALSGKPIADLASLASVKPAPAVAIVETPVAVDGDEVTVKVKVADAGGGIGDVRLYLNGAAVLLDRSRNLAVAETHNEAQVFSYKVRLVAGKNSLRAVAFNAGNSMQSTDAPHVIEARFAAKKPSLYALVIGIQEYDNPKLTLKYPVGDARLMAATLQKQTAGLFENVNVVELTSKAQTSKAAITLALQEISAKVSPDDLFVFFVASHGTVDNGEYFLITSNVGATSSHILKRTAFSQDDLKTLIANVPSTKKLVLIDTCNAGKLGEAIQLAMLTRGMDEDTALKILSRAVGSTIISASNSLQEALEGYKDHGLFTYVVAEGLKGAADSDKDGYVKTYELVDYVDNQVPELAEKVFNHKQYPTTSLSGQGFPVVRVK